MPSDPSIASVGLHTHYQDPCIASVGLHTHYHQMLSLVPLHMTVYTVKNIPTAGP